MQSCRTLTSIFVQNFAAVTRSAAKIRAGGAKLAPPPPPPRAMQFQNSPGYIGLS